MTILITVTNAVKVKNLIFNIIKTAIPDWDIKSDDTQGSQYGDIIYFRNQYYDDYGQILVNSPNYLPLLFKSFNDENFIINNIIPILNTENIYLIPIMIDIHVDDKDSKVESTLSFIESIINKNTKNKFDIIISNTKEKLCSNVPGETLRYTLKIQQSNRE